jgi:hypothetical protein
VLATIRLRASTITHKASVNMNIRRKKMEKLLDKIAIMKDGISELKNEQKGIIGRYDKVFPFQNKLCSLIEENISELKKEIEILEDKVAVGIKIKNLEKFISDTEEMTGILPLKVKLKKLKELL